MPFQGLWWLLCCRQGFTLLRRDYGEGEKEEDESFELRNKEDQMCSMRGTLDVNLTQPVRATNGCERFLQVSEEMRSLITEKNTIKADEDLDIVVKGWLQREVKGFRTPWIRLKKYWFVLNQDSLDYYSSNEKNAKQLGSLVLTSLCSVVWPDKQTYKETGYWNVTVYGRKHCFRLFTEHLNEAVHWVCAIQKVIDSKAPVETPTQLLIRDIGENCSNQEVVEQIYKRNPILRHTKSPLYAPLLPFSYGGVDQPFPSVKGYTALRDEAVKIFNSLQQLETARDPVPIIQGVLQTGLDLRLLRDEIYCQLIKQTTEAPGPNGQESLRCWQLLTCMSCTFLPSPPVLRFLYFHLKRSQVSFPNTEIDKYSAFISQSLEKTTLRECVPSWEEILVLIHRQEMLCTVHYPGAGSCQVPINSHTTAEEVVKKMIAELGLGLSRNVFALYEQNSQQEQAVGKTTIVADILTSLSGAERVCDCPWRLCFKVYCFLDTEEVPQHSVEFTFLYEQAHEMVIRGYLPMSEDTLQFLAALRLQFLNSDFSTHAPFPKLEELFPLHVLHARVLASSKPPVSSRSCPMKFHAGLLSGALPNSLWNHSLVKQKAVEDQKFKGRMKEEGANMMTAIIDKWKLMQGMDRNEAVTSYLSIVKEWPSFGSTLFDVEFYMSSTGSFSQKLWLGVGAQTLSLYKQGEVEPFESFSYGQISSFSVLDSNTLKVSAGDKDLLFETTKVDEITQLINTYLTSIANGQTQQGGGRDCSPGSPTEAELPAQEA
ncbi:pleckstrin homology domain-containing family H member 3 isoform X2 [Rhinatrema bivittatum]|uniref:pleckstrin homology domain-containing family H member 3 isoform X2 n=1 Tax=Rhinatrema bivittatum TaxID=194408 RepID=UPI001127FC02|nr:pleckstrin homology domain-containing family H member 3 isoform X2 [Rhinatrema bivittatum]